MNRKTDRRWALALALLCVLSPTASRAQGDFSKPVLSGAPVAISPISAPEGEFEASSPILSNVPATFSGANINTLLGADAFYDRGITGSNATIANVEAGHVWDGHDALGHVATYANSSFAWNDPGTPGQQQTDLVDRHATWVAAIAAGRPNSGPDEVQRGIAFGATLASGAIATRWNGDAYALGFSVNSSSIFTPYDAFFGSADVINSSWGGGNSPTGTNATTLITDALANENPSTTWVTSAGNVPEPNGVTFPASGYNSITVGALANGGDNAYDEVASFSSFGPQDWSGGGLVCDECRSPIDIVAPGSNLTAAFYGGQTGGNNPTLTDSSDTPGTTLYTPSLGGTSFAAPIVAGAATLVVDSSYADAELALNADARDARVVKAVLLNSATKIPGWDNGQSVEGGAIVTEQALDFASGAGALDIGAAYDQFAAAATRDVPGAPAGDQGGVGRVGWDYGEVDFGVDNVYPITTSIPRGAEFTATLAWFRQRTETFPTAVDAGQADLDLIIREVDSGDVVAQSVSGVNVVEHLHFAAPRAGEYEIVVNYFGDLFGDLGTEEYGLAWSVTVPEPGAGVLAALAAVAGAGPRGRRR